MKARLSDRLPTAAVVIVNYFKAKRLLEGLQSLTRQTAREVLSIGIVENSASPEERQVLARAVADGTFAMVEPASNIGYTRGCNVGVQSLPRARYVLLCNPDIIWDQPDAIERLVAIADADPSIGVIAPLQYSDDGDLVETARTFPTLLEQVMRRLRPNESSELHISASLVNGSAHSIDVDWVQSSCVLIRRTLWDSIGGLDQRYFLFMSDVELGRATWGRGYRVCLTSEAYVRADGKRASAGGLIAVLTSKAQRSHLSDAIKYYLAHGFRKLRRGRPVAPYDIVSTSREKDLASRSRAFDEEVIATAERVRD